MLTIHDPECCGYFPSWKTNTCLMMALMLWVFVLLFVPQLMPEVLMQPTSDELLAMYTDMRN